MFFVVRLSVFAFEACFVLRLFLPLKQFFSEGTHEDSYRGKRGFAHGFVERTTTRCWNRTAVANLSLAWQLLTMLRVVALL
jgi:hypothetical protein